MSHRLGVPPLLWRKAGDYQQPRERKGERERERERERDRSEGTLIQYSIPYQIGEDELKVCLIDLCHDIKCLGVASQFLNNYKEVH